MTVRAPRAEHWGRRLRRRPELEAEAIATGRPGHPVEVWASRDYLVQVFAGDVVRLTVNRTTRSPRGDRWADGLSWDELQRIKADVGRGDRWAVEIYPPDEHVVDVANMRHLWLVDEPPAFAWLNNPEGATHVV